MPWEATPSPSQPRPQPWSGRLVLWLQLLSPQAQALYFLLGDGGVHFDLGGSAFLFLNSKPHHCHLEYVVNRFRGKDFKKIFSGPVMFTAQYLMNRC